MPRGRREVPPELLLGGVEAEEGNSKVRARPLSETVLMKGIVKTSIPRDIWRRI